MLPVATLAGVFGLLPAVPATADQQVCSLVGCESQIVVRLAAVPRVAQVPFARVRVCASGRCSVTPARSSGAHLVAPALEGSSPVKVSVTFTTRSGKRLWSRTRMVWLTRSQPNGPDCPPVCWTGRLAVRDGRLVAA